MIPRRVSSRPWWFRRSRHCFRRLCHPFRRYRHFFAGLMTITAKTVTQTAKSHKIGDSGQLTCHRSREYHCHQGIPDTYKRLSSGDDLNGKPAPYSRHSAHTHALCRYSDTAHHSLAHSLACTGSPTAATAGRGVPRLLEAARCARAGTGAARGCAGM